MIVASTFHVGMGPSDKKDRFNTFLAGACGVHWAHGPINVVSVDFKDSHFEFRVDQ